MQKILKLIKKTIYLAKKNLKNNLKNLFIIIKMMKIRHTHIIKYRAAFLYIKHNRSNFSFTDCFSGDI